MTKKRKQILRFTLRLSILSLILLNISTAFHAYKFTHFSGQKPKSKAEHLSTVSKLKLIFFGISNPRPENNVTPSQPYEEVILENSGHELHGWYLPTDSAIGTVVLCHGYGGQKSSMLERARLFKNMGYNTFLFDFPGSGESSGNYTSIGYHEASDVIVAYNFALQKGLQPVILLGTSMGAVAIIKALHDFDIKPVKVILECPYESLLQTGKNRFENIGLPGFPAAHLLIFWSGLGNGFNAFGFKPVEYARTITAPTLLIYGEKDDRVRRFETDHIFNNLAGKKKLLLLKTAGHNNFLTTEPDNWIEGVQSFLSD